MFEKLKSVVEKLMGSIESPERKHIPREEVQDALKLLKEVERDVLEKELKLALESLEELDGHRKFFYLMGKLYVEVSKEEAIELVKKELEAIQKA